MDLLHPHPVPARGGYLPGNGGEELVRRKGLDDGDTSGGGDLSHPAHAAARIWPASPRAAARFVPSTLPSMFRGSESRRSGHAPQSARPVRVPAARGDALSSKAAAAVVEPCRLDDGPRRRRRRNLSSTASRAVRTISRHPGGISIGPVYVSRSSGREGDQRENRADPERATMGT